MNYVSIPVHVMIFSGVLNSGTHAFKQLTHWTCLKMTQIELNMVMVYFPNYKLTINCSEGCSYL